MNDIDTTYCGVIKSMSGTAARLNLEYHDNLYGFPLYDDHELLGRLILEINQAGLSWTTILQKQEAFRKAYMNFNIGLIAGFGEDDVQRLLNDAGIIRNRMKIMAAIYNARVILDLQKEAGTFSKWLDLHAQNDLNAWVTLFKKRFRFTGREIVNEFLMSTGYLPGAHHPNCPVYKKVIAQKPKWITR